MTTKSIGIDGDADLGEIAGGSTPYDEDLRGKPALPALRGALRAAPIRRSIWRSPRR